MLPGPWIAPVAEPAEGLALDLNELRRRAEARQPAGEEISHGPLWVDHDGAIS